ncbi:hypothetical protein ACQPX6_24870 [Actinomycetospora sp. CA-101289]|uniref:hypothetical protein n=1 Tax=Actinomycetospora sp. CA-101289 TaxID=3239893 RepID=UPI003D964740
MTVTLPPRPGERRYVATVTAARPVARPTAPPAPASPPVPPRTAPRRRSRRGRLGLAVGLPLAALVVGLLLGLLLGLVVVTRQAAPAPPPSAAATAAPALAAAFPDVAALGASCTPFDPGAQGYTTSTGARAVAVLRCDHGAMVPGGGVYYTQWPTAADARQWQADQVAWGPSLDGRASWAAAGADQGPWHARAGADGTVYATAAYADRPYGFDVVTRSAQDTPLVFGAMRLLPTAALPA